MMLPEDMRLWVGRDHFAWFLIDVIEGLDTSALECLGKPGKGRPGYDPRMLATLLVYAYTQGLRSSRRIEERCRTDAAFRVATGNVVPDHSTICRFRAAAALAGGPLVDLFTQGLHVAKAPGRATRPGDGRGGLARKSRAEPPRADGDGCGCPDHEHGDAAGQPAPA